MGVSFKMIFCVSVPHIYSCVSVELFLGGGKIVLWMYLIILVYRFRLVTRAKPVSWPGIKWANVDDSRLLIGIYQHGLGNWESIKEDDEIGLKNKVRT